LKQKSLKKRILVPVLFLLRAARIFLEDPRSPLLVHRKLDEVAEVVV
jgi:hypothetical protein